MVLRGDPGGQRVGYVIGGLVAKYYGWRTAFYVVVPPGVLGVCAFS